MKWKSQSTDEVGKEHDPLVGSWSWNDLPLVWYRCAMFAAKYPAARRLAMFFSFTVEATHLPPAPDMFNCAEKTWTRALELEEARVGKGGRRRG